MRGMELGARFGADIYVFWGGREGVETDAAKDPIEAEGRFRRALNFLCDHSLTMNYGYRFALEAKPNEPRGHMYFATTGHYLAFIETLKHPDMVGVNPEVAHEHMAGLNFTHGVAQALNAGKLFHIDLNDQSFGRYDQDFRFGAVDIKSAFFLVKFLEDHGYDGFRHFDAHSYRTADRADVIEFARGCIRTYEVLQDKARAWNGDRVIRSILAEVHRDSGHLDALIGTYSPLAAASLLKTSFNRRRMAARPLPYERLDQRTMEILLGVAK
jgi:xylose isomerase